MRYSRAAKYYQWLERMSYGQSLQKARCTYLGQIEAPGTALLVGEGYGAFLIPFLETYPHCKVTVIEESAEMIEVCRRRLEKRQLPQTAVTFIHRPLSTCSLPEKHYELIVSHFFFDNFRQDATTSMIQQLARCATPQSDWLISDFHIPNQTWRALRARIWLFGLYTFWRRVAHVPATELPEIIPALADCGFIPKQHRQSNAGLLCSSWYRRTPAPRSTGPVRPTVDREPVSTR
ncbi:class I SAM-dependent methyltransferase [Coraliomargarita parva]|uniref:class I SAM-dependent methyltransferase n=1 Tax=Coraliomargarita parva TaxID=3014050 RepID=UPI0022B3B841|nr:class I SAM-dependent methyltransferase [Coraliomargarita parva]